MKSDICDAIAQIQYRNESRDFHVTSETADLISDSIGFSFLIKGNCDKERCISTIASCEELKVMHRLSW